MKRIILSIFLICFILLSLCAFNLNSITPDDNFILYSKSPEKVAEILKSDVKALDETVKNNNILYLAVNENNTKQIQLVSKETDFSHSISSLNNLSNESINSLLTEITGIENIKGEIVYKDNQKFVKLNLKSNRGENEYILTQFLTVTNKTMYTLSFYTAIDEDIDYIENTFSVSKEKININLNKDYSSIKIIVICATVIFAAACLILLYTIIRDLIVSKKNFPLDNKDNMNLPE